MRNDDGMPPLDQLELFKRDQILGEHEERHPEILEELRSALLELAKFRNVTADDARKLLARWGVPAGNWMGSLFKNGQWVMVGTRPSATPGRHGNRIGIWRPKQRHET